MRASLFKLDDVRANELVESLRSRESSVFDHAFDQLSNNVDLIKHCIHDAAVREKNPRAKGALVELLGETKDDAYVKFLGSQLEGKQPEVVFWSFVALQTIGTESALEIAYKHDIREILRAFREKNIQVGSDAATETGKKTGTGSKKAQR